MSAAHTPGPWVSVQAECGNIYAMTNASNDYIRVDTGNPANARLIAGTTDLLDALQMAKHIVYADGTREQFAQVCAAILKATGAAA